jgi:protein-tyrosine phosphatase
MRQVGDYPLWIGNARDARDIRAVLAEGIRAVVDLAVEEPPIAPTREMIYLRFPLVDGLGNDPKLLRAMLRAVTALVRERVPSLVACGMGMSRSPAVAAVAYAAAHGLDPAEVLTTTVGTGDVSPALLAELQSFAEGVS